MSIYETYHFSRRAQDEIRRVYHVSLPPVISCFIGQEPVFNLYTNVHSDILESCESAHSSIGSYSYSYSHINYSCIGNYCSISLECIFNPGMHPLTRLSSHPFTVGNSHYPYQHFRNTTQGNHDGVSPITIGHDVWIGRRAILMGGITIGNGAVIGSNAVVTRNVPPYAIVAGVPAKIIRYRFSPELIAKLEASEWWNYDLPMTAEEPIDWSNPEGALNVIRQGIAEGKIKKLPQEPAFPTSLYAPFSKHRRFYFEISKRGTFIKLFGRWLYLHLNHI